MNPPNTPTSFILKGDIVYNRSLKDLASTPDGLLVCVDGRSHGVFPAGELPERYANLERIDHTGKLIIPGLVDLHTHAPQFSYRGTGMDLDLLDWLQHYTYPEEARYRDLAYARAAYPAFVEALAAGATTRVVVFATVHVPATLLLMDLLEKSGLSSFVGKVNMDRNAPDELREQDAAASLAATRDWLAQVAERNYHYTRPILTPRFIPSCTDELMAGLGELQRESRGVGRGEKQGLGRGEEQQPTLATLPVQSHLSESPREIAWVRELRPDARCYADAYLRSGLLGSASEGDEGSEGSASATPAPSTFAPTNSATPPSATPASSACPTIMAHCVHSSPEEVALLKQQGVWVAHCAESNTNIASGIAPVRTYLREGLRVGLGTDVAGGSSTSVFQAMMQSIQASKLRNILVDDSLEPLTATEALYLATLGGGSFWEQAGSRVGSFEEGYEFDAVVLNDPTARSIRKPQPAERLEHLIYATGDTYVVEKYVSGRRIESSRPMSSLLPTPQARRRRDPAPLAALRETPGA